MAAKKPGRQVAVPAPQREQVLAVRKLAEAGDLVRARQRLAALRVGFPLFKPLLALAWEVEDLCGDALSATACARAWHRQSPGSRLALQALASSARDAGFTGLHVQAVHRLRQVDEGPDVKPILDHIEAPLGRLTIAEAEAIDLSRMHLAMGEPAAAAEVLAGIDHPSARNNLALAHFMGGEPARAAEVALAAWQVHPANLFALDLLVRTRCWIDGLAACAQWAEPARGTTPSRAEDANARVALLRWLGDEEAARRAHAEVAGAEYWQEADERQLDRYDDLAGALSDAESSETHWFPGPWRRQLRELAAQVRQQRQPAGWRERWDAHLDACDAHADYLQRAGALGSTTVRELAREILLLRARRGDAPALSALHALLRSPMGPDSERSGLLQHMADAGLNDGAVSAHLNGELRDVRSYSLNVHAEPRPSPFTAAGEAIAGRMHAALARGDLNAARDAAEALCACEPGQAAAWANLGALLEDEAPHQDVAAAFSKAHELAPEYLFGRCGLARVRAAEGRVDEARALLDGLLERTDWHHSEYRSYLMAQVKLAEAMGDAAAARKSLEVLHDLMDRFAG
jgi:Tfp pilus assembly protein PilF